MLRKIFTYTLFILVAAAASIAGYYYWQHEKQFPSTNDAYISAHKINVAAQVSGVVKTIHAHNQAMVKKNQLLFTINPKSFQIALASATANFNNVQQTLLAEKKAVDAAKAVYSQRRAEFINAEKQNKRIAALAAKNFISRSQKDAAKRRMIVAKQATIAAKDQWIEAKATLGKPGQHNAQLKVAKAAVAQAQLDLQHTKIMAPIAGQLAQFTLRPGQTVTAYHDLFVLINRKAWWAVANMKETKLARIRVGQKATVQVDMYPNHVFQGTVKSISPGSGSSFSLLPAENATGNWVKVTQRFPIRIAIKHLDPQFPLRIGASATVTIDTAQADKH